MKLQQANLNKLYSQWFRTTDAFPREYGLGRQIVNNYDELISLINKYNFANIYSSVFSKWQLFFDEYDTIPLDVEAGSKEAHNDVITAYDICQQIVEKVKPSRMYFTGRGYHLFYDLPAKISGRENYKSFVKKFIKYYDIINVDHVILGNVRAVMRLPATLNTKTNFWMVQISPDMKLTKIIENAKANIHYEWKNMDFRIDEKIFEIEEEKRPEPIPMQIDTSEYPDCITNAISQLKDTGELDHIQRLHLASYLTMIGKKSDINQLLANHAKDYNKNITDYQLNWIEQKGYVPYSCNKVPSDICKFADKTMCPFYPNITKKLRQNICRKL